MSSPRHALLSNLTADLSVPDQPAFAMAIISPSEVGNPMQAKMRRSDLAVAGLAALGIVFGDIGTSPLYTLKTAFDFLSGEPAPERILGILSLLIWTLFLVTSIKYVAVAMSIDNDGEGGILALMALLGKKGNRRPVILVAGLLGAALIYGDGAITPAISVLSALEGLNIAAPSVEHYVVPAAVAILVLLFAAQPLGTSRIGAAFGPIMLLWFISIAALGLWGVARVTAHFGFMQRPDIPRLLEEAQQRGCAIWLDDVTYYVGHENILHRRHGPAMPHWQERIFAAMMRNASHVTDYFRLPTEQVVEIGRQISI